MMNSRKMRIGVDSEIIGIRTGIGSYSFNLLRALAGDYSNLEFRGFGHFFWSEIGATELASMEVSGGENSGPAVQAALQMNYRFSAARSISRGLRAARFFSSRRLQSLDLFHALNFVPKADPGVPTLPVVYDLSFVRYPDVHPKERLRSLERLPRFVARAPLVQTISEFSRNEIAATYGYPKEKIFVAPPAAAKLFRPAGIDVTRGDLKTLGLEPASYLLAVGTLEPRKNLRTLIAAYGKIPKVERSRAPLVIVGGTGWGNLELPAATAGLVQEGSLRFLGAVSNPQLRSLYEGAVALMFPSVYEGFGMPVVEAMSCGTQVVHSMDTSMDEITGDLAIRLPAADVDAWSLAIRQVIDAGPGDPDMRAARIARSQVFDWHKAASLVKEAYSTLIR